MRNTCYSSQQHQTPDEHESCRKSLAPYLHIITTLTTLFAFVRAVRQAISSYSSLRLSDPQKFNNPFLRSELSALGRQACAVQFPDPAGLKLKQNESGRFDWKLMTSLKDLPGVQDALE